MTSLSAGRGASVLGGPNESSAVEQARDVPTAMRSLQSGQTLLLDETEVHLDSTLFIAASDIMIRGAASGMTTVRCPAQGGAFVIT